MNWAMLQGEHVLIPYRHPNGERCGWCIGGDHENCVVSVDMTIRKAFQPGPASLHFVWTCQCGSAVPHPASRCLNCLRPGVAVDHRSRCTDRDGCQAYLLDNGPFRQPEPPRINDEEDEDEAPHAMTETQRADLIEDAEYLVLVGEWPEHAARRLGCDDFKSLERDLRHVGRYDLVSALRRRDRMSLTYHQAHPTPLDDLLPKKSKRKAAA